LLAPPPALSALAPAAAAFLVVEAGLLLLGAGVAASPTLCEVAWLALRPLRCETAFPGALPADWVLPRAVICNQEAG
jgi:hypothetical protein